MALYSYQTRRPGGGKWSTIVVYADSSQFTGKFAPERTGEHAWRIVVGDLMAGHKADDDIVIIDSWTPPPPSRRAVPQARYAGSWAAEEAPRCTARQTL